MAEFLDLIESMRAEEASVSKLFSGEGVGIRGRSGAARSSNGQAYATKLVEAARFVQEVYSGKRRAWQLQEALGTADFPLLFGDIIDRQLLANYRETPSTYRNYCRMATVSDFRTVKRFAVNGSEAVLTTVLQQEEYPESKVSDVAYSYSVAKYGRSIPFAWETMINDDLDALKDIPARFGKAARRTEEKFATQLFVDVNGPHASFFTVGNKNQVTTTNGSINGNNPVLSIQGLQSAWNVLNKQLDTEGEPITIDAVTLVVPPQLEVTAMNILNAMELWLTSEGGVATQQVHVANWMKNRLTLNVNFYIPIVASTANGGTSWFLFASPNGERPALEFGHLRGHEEPELFMKDPNAVRIGGGAVNPMDGDFDTDSIRYKVRHVIGGQQIDPKMAVSSNGSGA